MRRRPDEGGTAAEYALIAAYVGAVIVIAVLTLGGSVLAFFETTIEKFP